MKKNLLKTKNKRIQFLQEILTKIHEQSTFSAREHKYVVDRNVLTKKGVKVEKVSPFSVSTYVSDSFPHFNEKNWDIPASRSGIAKEDLIYNRLLAQVMGCVKGSIIHEYLEEYVLGKAVKPNENLSSIIRDETKYNFYPKLKDVVNLNRRLSRNIDMGKFEINDLKIEEEILKSLPQNSKGVLSVELNNLDNINELVEEVSDYLVSNKVDNLDVLNEFLSSRLNFPENTINELNHHLANCELNKENLSDAFSLLEDNEFLSKKEFQYPAMKISIINSFQKFNEISKEDINLSQDSEKLLDDIKDAKSLCFNKLSSINDMFLLNNEVTAKTLQELKAEEYRLNKDINSAVLEVFENLNAGNLVNQLKEKGLNFIAVEQRMSVGGVIGTADIICATDDGNIVIADYKTNKGKLSVQSLEHYGLQLTIYRDMITKLVESEIKNSPELQSKVCKLWKVKDYKEALDVIGNKVDPIILHISSTEKIRDSDIDKMKVLSMRKIISNMNKMEFSSQHEKVDWFQKEAFESSKKINQLLDKTDSCKFIYTPKTCEIFDSEIQNKKQFSIEQMKDDIFQKTYVDMRVPINHIYSSDLDLVIPKNDKSIDFLEKLRNKKELGLEVDVIKEIDSLKNEIFPESTPMIQKIKDVGIEIG